MQLRRRSHVYTGFRLRSDFEHNAEAVFASQRGAVQVPFAVDDESTGRITAVGALEDMQPGVLPCAVGTGGQFVHNATVVGRAAPSSRAVEVARFVHSQMTVRVKSIGASLEVIE